MSMTKYVVIVAMLLLALTAISFAGQTPVVTSSVAVTGAAFEEPVNTATTGIGAPVAVVSFEEPVNT